MVNNAKSAVNNVHKVVKKGLPQTEISTLVAQLIEKGASKEELIQALQTIANKSEHAKGSKQKNVETQVKNVDSDEVSVNTDLREALASKVGFKPDQSQRSSGQTSAEASRPSWDGRSAPSGEAKGQVQATDDQPLVELITLPHKEDFLLDLTNTNYSKETVYNYDRDLAVFESFLTVGKIPFANIDKKTIMQYKGFLQTGTYLAELKKIGWERLFLGGKAPNTGRAGKGKTGALASKSINRMLSSIRSFLRFLIDFDLEPRPIAPEAVKLVKLERKRSQVAELPELIRLVECPTEFEKQKLVAIRNRAILELLFSTGMRISELTKLDREQVDLSAVAEARKAEGMLAKNEVNPAPGQSVVQSTKVEPDELNESKNVPAAQGKLYVMGKGKKQRFVYLTPRAQTYILDYLKTRKDPYPALFIPYRGGRLGRRGQRLSVNYIQAKIAEYRRRLGIIVPTSAHSLRHGFATYLAEQGASPAAIQILLGHESLNTTDKYVHASDKFAAETHKKFHPLYDKK